MIHLKDIDTEKRNPSTMHIDELDTDGILRLINQEDHRVAPAVKEELPNIAKAVDAIYHALRSGGRLIYIGAGTSGRLGVLDASECPPTYGVSSDLVQGIIAGGETALTHSIEGAEDDPELAEKALKNISFCNRDILVGIAASGRTPYVLGAVQYARACGAATIGLTSSRDSALEKEVDICIAPSTGPECVTGSTRMKSGTAQKMVLNMLSTAVMIKLGKVYQNLMVDVQASNEKLKKRALSIVMSATDENEEICRQALSEANNECKTAIVMLLLHKTAQEARTLLAQTDGHISRLL